MPNMPTIRLSASTTQKAFRQLLQFAVNHRRNILLKLLTHMVGRELPVGPDKKRDDLIVVYGIVSANHDPHWEQPFIALQARSSIEPISFAAPVLSVDYYHASFSSASGRSYCLDTRVLQHSNIEGSNPRRVSPEASEERSGTFHYCGTNF
jgi:hypothetical protein